MRKLLILLLLLWGTASYGQTIYQPANGDSLKLAVQISGAYRSIYAIDLFKHHLSVTDSATRAYVDSLFAIGGSSSGNADSLGGQPAAYYETLTHAIATYQPIGSYLTPTTGDARYSLLSHTHTFASLTSKPTTLSGYGITDAYPLTGNPSNFLTGITSSQVTTALGFTPYNATNPNGYITGNQNITITGDISGSGSTAITTAIGAGKVTNSMLAGSIAASKLVGSDITLAESQITGLTTDLAGKVTANTAITGSTKTKITYDSKGLVTAGADLTAGDIPNIAESQVTNLTTDLAGKQGTITLTTTGSSGAATLVGNTLNIPQYSGGSSVTITNNLTTTTTGTALDAAQGKVLKDLVDANTTNISSNTSAIAAINTRTAHDLGSMSKATRDAIASPVVGDRIFQTDDGWYEYYDGFWGWMPLSITNEWRKYYGWEYFNDFLNTSTDGTLAVSTANSGGVSNNLSPNGSTSESTSYSVLNLNTTNTARAGYITATNTVALGSGTTVYETRVYFNSLSTSTDRFQFFAGFYDVNTAVDQTDGVYFLYDEGGITSGSTATGSWQLVTSSNSFRTFSIGASPVTIIGQTWYKLRIEVNATGSTATFYVNGTSIGTVTTNIPKTSGRYLGFGVNGIKSAGTTNTFIMVDYVGVKQKFSTPR